MWQLSVTLASLYLIEYSILTHFMQGLKFLVYYNLQIKYHYKSSDVIEH